MLISCESEINRPVIRESTGHYTLDDLRYSKNNDSITILKNNARRYRLDIVEDSNSFTATWTDRIRTTAIDTTHSELENILNNNEFTDGLSALFDLDENGDINSLVNWPQVKSHIDSMSILYLEMNGFTSEEIDQMNPLLNTYLTKENMMNSLFKGIGVFHNFYSIDANFTDTLVKQGFGFDRNESDGLNEAEIHITHPTSDLVDYLTTTEFTTSAHQNFLQELEKLSETPVDFSQLNEVHIIDTIYYRFNTDLQELIYVYAKRKMDMDTLQLFHEIIIEKEDW